MKLNGKHILSFGAILILVSSCYNDKKEELYDYSNFVCDTSSVTYLMDIKPILEDNCYRCHSGGRLEGTLDLSKYNQVKNKATNGRLMKAIKGIGSFQVMPPDAPTLSDCNILKIETWIANGALE